MTMTTRLGSVSALAFLITSPAAFADVTAQQVWSDWQSYFKGFGYEISGSESTSGDTLTISDAALTVKLPQSDGSATVTLGKVTLRNTDDGRVVMNLQESIPITADFALEPGRETSIKASYLIDGYEMTVSGDAQAMVYDYTADAVTFRLDSLTTDGKPVEISKAEITLNGVTGAAEMGLGTLRKMAQTLNAASVSYDVDVTPPDGKTTKFVMAGTAGALTYKGDGAIPTMADTGNLSEMLQDGFAYDMIINYADSKATMKVSGHQGEVLTSSSTLEQAMLAVVMNQETLRYSAAVTNASSTMQSASFPMPVEVTYAAADFNFAMPPVPGDETRDAALRINLSDLTVSDAIWGMFDPMGKLSRDPATLLIDLSGKVKLFADIMNPEGLKTHTGPVGEPETLTINALRLDVAGAELTGAGGFGFDKTDTTSFPGMPAPEGTLDLKLTGANALLDNLTAMGLLPADKAMGARMMMGLFAVPGEGADTLTSKIEVNDQGHVLANGQRLK